MIHHSFKCFCLFWTLEIYHGNECAVCHKKHFFVVLLKVTRLILYYRDMLHTSYQKQTDRNVVSLQIISGEMTSSR